jgi:dolichol-phosphate mannosyltransferase
MQIEKVSVVIPTYNESENIEKLIPEILHIFKENKIKGEIIVVDDNSSDGTGIIAEKLAKKFGNMVVLHRKGKLGIGSACADGIKKSRGNVVITLDADFSHPPQAIPALLNEIKKGNEIVIGSRYIKGGEIRGWGVHRKVTSRGANFLARLFLGLKTRDMTTYFRAYTKQALNKIDMEKIIFSGYFFSIELIYKAEKKGIKIKEVPVLFIDRESGKSKLGIKDELEFLSSLLKLRFNL